MIRLRFEPMSGSSLSARDVGFLLAKHPDKIWSLDDAKLYFTLATDSGLEMVYEPPPREVEVHVSALPYLLGARTASGLGKALGDAIKGRCKSRPDLVDVKWQIQLEFGPIRGFEPSWIRMLEPLGYIVQPQMGEMKAATEFLLKATHPGLSVQEVVSHLYVLLLAMDKTWSVTQDEQIQKVLSSSASWLSSHPAREEILRRLNPRRVRSMRSWLQDQEAADEPPNAPASDTFSSADAPTAPPSEADGIDEAAVQEARPESASEPESREMSLQEERRAWLVAHIQEWTNQKEDATSILDFGCGTGWVLEDLAKTLPPRHILIGVEPDPQVREKARHYVKRRGISIVAGALGLERGGMFDFKREQHGRVAVIASEVLEHIDPERLDAAVQSLRDLSPDLILLTLPDRSYNEHFGLEKGELRHTDHRWEMPRNQLLWKMSALFSEYRLEAHSIASTRWPIVLDRSPTVGIVATRKKTIEFRAAETITLPDPRAVTVPHPDDPSVRVPVKISRPQHLLALDAWSRFTVDPRILPWLPPTMAPGGTSDQGVLLEHPEDAFRYYEERGVDQVHVQTKHMGSRAVALVRRGGDSVMYTRMGRPIRLPEVDDILERLNQGLDENGLWGEYLDEAIFDGELLPWSALGERLIDHDFRAVHRAGLLQLVLKQRSRTEYNLRSLESQLDVEAVERDIGHLQAFKASLEAFDRPGPVQYAPFHLLAMRGPLAGVTFLDVPHDRMMDTVREVCDVVDPHGYLLRRTRGFTVDLHDPDSRAAAVDAWARDTATGVEGYVVKAPTLLYRVNGKPVQPMVKVRGAEYLRIIYGPDYMDRIEKLRHRKLTYKRFNAMQQSLLGFEALEDWAARRSVPRQEKLFALLATSFRADDPRL